MEDRHPLLVCLENAAGEEVILRVEPGDDFFTFLERAKSVLGYDIDISSVTKGQPFQLHENVYQFLVNLEITDPNMVQTYDPDMIHTYDPSMIQTYNTSAVQAHDPNLEQTYSSDILQTHDLNLVQKDDSNIGQGTDIQLDTDQLYVLNDGTQIRASQIYFDNEDTFLDLSLEHIPFIKVNDDFEEASGDHFENVMHKIIASPVPTTDSSPKHGFINHVPFKLVCNNTTGFEAQFTRYLEAKTKTYATLSTVTKRNKSPRSLIRDNFNDKEEFRYTREEILNMLKDSPVTSIPYEITEKKHVRKMDPTKMLQKATNKAINIEGLVIGDGGSRDCFICGKNVSDDKIYIFNNEDQKMHKCSPQKKISTQLKIICENCLNNNFKPSRMKSATQFLNSEEYLVIRNNQQYIFQKTKNFKFRSEVENVKMEEFVKFEIGSDGEIVTKPVDDDVILVHDGNGRKDSDSDVEIIETDMEVDKIINNMEEADEDVQVFLGKYECDDIEAIELKCRFCHRIFSAVTEVIEHGETHKHVLEDDVVFPCPLCDYGYASFKWLKGHLLAAHDKKAKAKDTVKDIEHSASITTQIRSSNFIEKQGGDDSAAKNPDRNDSNVHIVIKTEVKQEAISSDDEIWIVQTGDDNQLDQILDADGDSNDDKCKKCQDCSVIFTSSEVLSTHKCSRGMKRRCDDGTIMVPTEEDFLRRAHGKPRATTSNKSNQGFRKKSKDPSESQIVICHNCNQSFTSKVRLKFHMQFHESTSMLRDGQYQCTYCDEIFASETKLFDHVHFTHEKTKRWQCPVQDCGKMFSLRATLTKHSRTHTDTRRYVCVTCGKRFLDKQTLDEHGVTHLRIKPYQCHICLKQLTRVSRLRMHVRSHEEELAPTLVLVCRICSRAFRDAQEAQDHAAKSTECLEVVARKLKTEEETVQLSPTSGIVRQTIQIIESPEPRISRQVTSPVAAPLLSKLSDEASPLIRVVEVEKAFRCEYCEDVFYMEDGLNAHRAVHKGVKKPFTCHVCKVSFATYSRCTTHKTTHGFYKRSSTTEAGATVIGYNDFPTVKHFLCEDCGRSYLHWTYLQVHRRMKHPDGNHLHNCNQCDMTFPNSWSLSYHRKKNHTAKVSIEENTKQDLVQNIRTNRIPCRDCDEILPNKTALYRHRNKEHHIGISVQNWTTGLTSTSQRQKVASVSSPWVGHAWSCGRCPRRFRTRADLRAHARLTHPRHLAVIEVQGLSVNSEEALDIVKRHNINTDRIIEINFMSFPKGSTSIVPNSARALAILGNVPRTTLTFDNKAMSSGNVMEFQHVKDLYSNPRRATVLRPASQSEGKPSGLVQERSDL